MNGRWFRWSRSLYWRIALSFAVFTAAMLVAQNLLFSYLRERPNPSFLSPNALAMLVAADIQESVAASPSIDLNGYLRRKYADTPQRIYVALRDGRIGGNTASPMPEDIRQATVATLDGANVREATSRIETRGRRPFRSAASCAASWCCHRRRRKPPRAPSRGCCRSQAP